MKHIPALDGLRGVAVLLVIAFHSVVPGFSGGYRGVDMFFVLSGFIITTLLLGELARDGRVAVGKFFMRRVLRLFPALVLIVFLVCLCDILLPGISAVYPAEAAASLLYLSDIAIVTGHMRLNSWLMHTWTLATEAHFYLLWPFVLTFLRRLLPDRGCADVLLTLYLLATLWKMIGGQGTEAAYYIRFDLHMSGLILGSWLAAYRFDRVQLPKPRLLAGISATVFAITFLPMGAQSLFGFNIGIMVCEIFTCLAIYLVMEAQEGNEKAVMPVRILRWPPLVWLGKVSYGCYLFHYPLSQVFWIGRQEWFFTFSMTFSVTLILACLSYYLLERPFLKLKARYTPS